MTKDEHIVELVDANTELRKKVKDLQDKCSLLLDKLYLSGLRPEQISLVEQMQDVLGV